jgi:hypothetical protein
MGYIDKNSTKVNDLQFLPSGTRKLAAPSFLDLIGSETDLFEIRPRPQRQIPAAFVSEFI